ncbi:hypothetical protein [Neobacillus sp. FSL H8-0543]|uniref:hypothetical protein n=1 Tax=Neobacillus sp. FSL H8-0543 TaxID=2954672 RepID=UPI0031598856
MYLLQTITDDVRSSQLAFSRQLKTKRLVLCAVFACLAAVFQAAGGFLPGVGYFLSPLATAPILFCTMISLPLGFASYVLTNLLLFILQPTELIIFPFTTGLLGLGTGAAYFFFKKRLSIIASGAILLTLGILTLLFGLNFPVLGPAVSGSFSFLAAGSIFLFAFLYNLIWVEISLLLFKRLRRIITS